MKRLLIASLASVLATIEPRIATSAEGAGDTQELQSVLASDKVKFARWFRQPDAFVLVVALHRNSTPPVDVRASADTASSGGIVESALEAMLPPASVPGASPEAQDRRSFFIGHTIANLRGLDPAFCGRTLTLIDGRRLVQSGDLQQALPQLPRPYTSAPQPYRSAIKDPRVAVWLLKADGTHIVPATYSCDAGPSDPSHPDRRFEMAYAFPVAEGAEAIAAAIRVHDEFFIEKLQALQPLITAQ